MRWDDPGWCWRTAADTWGATSVPGLAVAGDCARIQGAEVLSPADLGERKLRPPLAPVTLGELTRARP